jgi:hypothetical protein
VLRILSLIVSQAVLITESHIQQVVAAASILGISSRSSFPHKSAGRQGAPPWDSIDFTNGAPFFSPSRLLKLEAFRRDQQGWEEIAAIAKALYAEAEMTPSNLRTRTLTTPRCGQLAFRLSLNQMTVCDEC